MNGTGFPLTALFTWQGSSMEKKTHTKNNQLTRSHSSFKSALLQSYRMHFKSGLIQLISKSSACTRHRPSYHNKHTGQLLFDYKPLVFFSFLILRWQVSSIQHKPEIFIYNSASQKKHTMLSLKKARGSTHRLRTPASFTYSILALLMMLSPHRFQKCWKKKHSFNIYRKQVIDRGKTFLECLLMCTE